MSKGAWLCLVLLTGLSGLRAAAGEDPAACEKLFREGVDLYQRGQYTDAQAKLRQLMALEPRKEMAARLVEEAGVKAFAQMMANPRMGNEPSRLWDLYRKYYVGKLADGERMAKMAARAVDPRTSEDERALLFREFGELGHYAVPYLAPYLKDAQHEDFRTYARVAIARMGPVAVLPLVALLGSKDELMRCNAILTLNDIEPADDRAIAGLKARLEDAKETEQVKKYAALAIQRITGLQVPALKPAANYFYEAANRYYLEMPGTADEAMQVDGYLWHLNEAGDLIPVLFPLWAWNEQMAEDLVLKGMAIEPDQTDLYPLAACIWASQYQEVEALVDIVGEAPSQHFFSEEEKQTVLAWKQKLVDCRNLVSACGKWYVNEALLKALRDMKKHPAHPRLGDVACFLCRSLKDLDPLGELLAAPVAAPVAVGPVAPGQAAVLTSIEVVPAVADVPPGGKVQFQATPLDQYGKPLAGAAVVWSADGGTVDAAGLFTAGQTPGRFPVYATATGGPAAPGAAAAPPPLKAEAKAEVATPIPAGQTPTRPAGPGARVPPIPGEGDARPADHLSALAHALDCPDQNVQYDAALALAAINRFPEAWVGQDKAATTLARGVSENKPLQILVVDENHNIRNEVRSALEALGLHATDAVNGRDALIKARSFPPKDLVFIADSLRTDLNAEQLMEELKADVRTRYTPVAILCNRDARTATQARFGADLPLVEREMKGDDLKKAVEDLEKRRPSEAVPKRKAHETAVACATALAGLDPRWTNIPIVQAVPNCYEALVNRKDDVRIPAATFLGKVKGGDAKDKVGERLLEVALKTENAVELRLAAAKSLCRVMPEKYTDEALKAQGDKEHILQEWFAIHFGSALRANKQLIEFLSAKRIDKEKKEK